MSHRHHDAPSSYQLIYNPPTDPAEGHGLGWTLMAFDDGRRRWATNLATHGAPATASATTAQSAANRALAEHGVTGPRWASAPPNGPLGAYTAVPTADE